ncbi:TIGR03620 family F420-dependent LLM class oxidoreductase [Protofrankia coriariae]|uniref:F420-dependent oxidoreductase n=1 Tax=Protofrankia coriariae TaxID=1562887 RepID=A0ABR5F197_9ACTN|nr:TIGR03620 family F420-dependent LLM class oxidoreductase [Protofrankia coriariae]KLL10485.1 F420-dependent oxidoreductase [Protofrankia coriariae]
MVTLGPVGIAASGLSADHPDAEIDIAREAEALGYSTLWLPGGQGNNLPVIGRVVRATEHIQVASGILSVDVVPAREVAQAHADLEKSSPGRFVVGLGGAHGARPLQTLNSYLDDLDTEAPVVPAAARVLAALGPAVLALARDRAAGAYPFLVTPEYVEGARATLGADSALAVLLSVVPETDPTAARAAAAEPLRFLGTVPGYRRNFLRQGFTEEQIADVDDRLVDAVTAWGSLDTIVTRVREYHAAGADQVVLRITAGNDPFEVWLRRFAEALLT